ncbi:ion transporter [Bacillus canaveralius]|uniref:Ion transporter n=1 Tax=Bacillus canaveralius TaxID=1403243 RepID=A0A2N5GLS5_9BACI|nr:MULTISPECIES: potassium channel family protein [Bacillus]PLR82809.1 ion transporter [Bacillus canaveralius]PLR85178.1 ion transporter [Bacillus sp. V33-4]PLR97186.1 ion transporter [Bacillus canaveralius]
MQQHLYSNFLRLPLLIRILMIALLVIVTFGAIIHLIEPQNFPSIFDGIWWAIITASTVGYGDYAPESFWGRIVGVLLILVGAGLLSSYFVTITATTVKKHNEYIDGKAVYRGMGHIIIIGWNERSKEIIQSILNTDKHMQIILIDETLQKKPLSMRQLHFLKGRANQDEILHKANINGAGKVLITADQNKDELQADMNSILTLLSIKGIRPELTCIVEILTSEQVANAKRAGADEIIRTNSLTSFVMIHGLTSQEKMGSILELLSQLEGSRLTFSGVTDQLIGKTFMDAAAEMLANGILIVGVKRGKETYINPPHPFTIERNDQLLEIVS